MIVNSPFVGHFSPLHNAIVAARAAAAEEAYQIDNAVIFDNADSSYLFKTIGAGGNPTDLAVSMWGKRSIISAAANPVLLYARQDVDNSGGLMFTTDDKLQYWNYAAGVYTVNKISTAVFRDVSAYSHIFLYIDTNAATAEDRFQIWINGVRITDWSTNTNTHAQSTGILLGSNNPHKIGMGNTAGYPDLLMADFHFAWGGTAPDVNQFGEFDINGVWQPKEYTGVYGTNGSHLDFADNTHFGNDVSGNNNDWTDSGMATNHQVTDTPTNNYCTWNALDIEASASLSDGALKAALSTVADLGSVRGTFGMSSGKWYWEVTVNGTGPREVIGIMTAAADLVNKAPGADNQGYGYFSFDGTLYYNGGYSAYGATFTTNDVIGVALDMDAGTLHFYKNNVDQGEAVSGLTGTWFPAFGEESSAHATAVTADFGQRGFAYTPPSGFVALCTDNLPVPAILKGSEYFNNTTYVGDGAASHAITGVGFQPDFVWLKDRDNTYSHQLYDAVRGATKYLLSDSTVAEVTSPTLLTSFDSDGFTVDTNIGCNASGDNFISWNWKESVLSGFDIVPFVGTGVAHAVNHSLGVVPDMIIVKNRNSASAKGWRIYHSANTSAPETDYLALDTDAATADALSVWNDVAPTSTQFTVGDGGAVNEDTKNLIAYLFAEVEGFSKFGSYTGNGDVDGPFLWCGFRPAFVLTKRTDVAGYWWIQDTSRSPYNDASAILFPNVTQIEFTSAGVEMDIVSNGFKLRHTSVNQNASGGTYVFAAFAEHPFKSARAR